MGVRHPESRSHTKAWESITPTQRATPKRGSPSPQLQGPRQSVGVRLPNSKGHAKAWESITQTQGATPKRGLRLPNSRGHAKAWESINPTQGAMPKRESLSPKLKGSSQSVGVCHPNPRDPTKAWQSVCVTPKYLNQINSVRCEHHLSTALFALQQHLDSPLRMAFLPSQHNTKPVCVCVLCDCAVVTGLGWGEGGQEWSRRVKHAVATGPPLLRDGPHVPAAQRERPGASSTASQRLHQPGVGSFRTQSTATRTQPPSRWTPTRGPAPPRSRTRRAGRHGTSPGCPPARATGPRSAARARSCTCPPDPTRCGALSPVGGGICQHSAPPPSPHPNPPTHHLHTVPTVA